MVTTLPNNKADAARLLVRVGLLAGLFFFAWRTLAPGLYSADDKTVLIADGEGILHRINALYHLPMSGISGALMLNHSPILPWQWRLICGALALGLMSGVAGFVGGSAAFSIALLVGSAAISRIIKISWYGDHGHFQAFFALLIMLVAGLSAWRAHAPTPARSLILAIAIGETLLYRSTLVFFPPILAASEFLSAPRDGRRALRTSLLLLLFVPYLFILPWSLLKSVQNQRFILLEDSEADPIVIGGALGLIMKPIDADVRPLTMGDGAIRWAISETVRHPVRYLRGYLSRLRFVFDIHPLLIIMGLFGAWRSWKNKQARCISVLAAYLLFVHCVMSLSPEYFEPLWPLLAILGSLSFYGGSPRPAHLGKIIWGWFVIVSILSVVTVSAVLAYAWSSLRDPALTQAARLDAAIARNPSEAWLLALRGGRRVHSGDVGNAISDLSRAAAQAPDDPGIQATLAWAELLSGKQKEFLARASAMPSQGADFYGALLLGCGYLRIGELGKAAEYFSRTFAVAPTGPHPRHDSVPELREVMTRRSLREYRRVIVELEALAPDMPYFSAERRALENVEREDRAWWRKLSNDRPLSGGIGASYKKELLTRLDPSPNLYGSSSPAVILVEKAAGAESSRAAIGYLNQAIALDPQFMPAYVELVDRYITQKRGGEASSLFERALLERPAESVFLRAQRAAPLGFTSKPNGRAGKVYGTIEDAGSVLDQAENALTASNIQVALGHLSRAVKMNLDAGKLGRAAALYQQLKRYPEALGLLDRLILLEPRSARWRADRGVVKTLMGVSADADLMAAIALEPKFLPPYLTLAASYESKGRRKEALRIYEEALAQPAAGDLGAAGVRTIIAEQRRKLLKGP